MNSRLLIDAIIRQTTVLIAQLSTADGVRSPLAHVADEVFLTLSEEIERQGATRKVAADMFGMALRSYQRKVQRLQESRSQAGQTLWEAVLEFVLAQAPVRRDAIIERFAKDDALAVSSVLVDLVNSGLIYSFGRSDATVYGKTTEADRRALSGDDAIDALATLMWGTVFRSPGLSAKDLVVATRVNESDARQALERLLSDGRVLRDSDSEDAPLRCVSFVIPEGAAQGWEAAVFDHFQAMARAVGEKARLRGSTSAVKDLVGGTTLHFGVFPGHPFEERSLGLLRRFREELAEFWKDVSTYNRENGLTEDDVNRVTFYFGQHVIFRSGRDDEQAGTRAAAGEKERE